MHHKYPYSSSNKHKRMISIKKGEWIFDAEAVIRTQKRVTVDRDLFSKKTEDGFAKHDKQNVYLFPKNTRQAREAKKNWMNFSRALCCSHFHSLPSIQYLMYLILLNVRQIVSILFSDLFKYLQNVLINEKEKFLSLSFPTHTHKLNIHIFFMCVYSTAWDGTDAMCTQKKFLLNHSKIIRTYTMNWCLRLRNACRNGLTIVCFLSEGKFQFHLYIIFMRSYP